MKVESTILTVLNVLARFVGIIWVLGGLVCIVSSFIDTGRRLTYLVVGALFLAAGIGLILAKRARIVQI